MKVLISSCIFAAAAMLALAAPTLNTGASVIPQEESVESVPERELQREKRSSYGTPYAPPCAAPPPIPVIPPPLPPPIHSPYPSPYPPIGYGLPHYRESETPEEHEMMSFSDPNHFMSHMNFESMHMPMARYQYPIQAPAQYGGYGAPLVPPTISGPALGIFPKANVGGCSIPLLLSCSPSIVPGKIVSAHPHYSTGSESVQATSISSGPAPTSSDSYRGVDEQSHHEMNHEDNASHQHLTSIHEAHPSAAGMHQ